MPDIDALKLSGGRNIALKIPDHLYLQTLRFYRDVLKLTPDVKQDGQVCFEFGETEPKSTLWLDRTEATARPDVWLEIKTADLDATRAYLISEGLVVPEKLEKLPKGFPGFWVVDPAGLVLLVSLHGE